MSCSAITNQVIQCDSSPSHEFESAWNCSATCGNALLMFTRLEAFLWIEVDTTTLAADLSDGAIVSSTKFLTTFLADGFLKNYDVLDVEGVHRMCCLP